MLFLLFDNDDTYEGRSLALILSYCLHLDGLLFLYSQNTLISRASQSGSFLRKMSKCNVSLQTRAVNEFSVTFGTKYPILCERSTCFAIYLIDISWVMNFIHQDLRIQNWFRISNYNCTTNLFHEFF